MNERIINDFGGHVVGVYQVLIGEIWVRVNPGLPLSEQTCGMRGYRSLDFEGNVLKQSDIKPAPQI